MENFADFIIKYIQKTEIHDVKGWLNQLQAYEWNTESGVERYSDGILTTKQLLNESKNILNSPDNDKKWHRHCEDIRNWGGMIFEIPFPLASDFKKSVIFLSKYNPATSSDFSTIPICGKRIATASKIYYFSDPLRWTIYDSRVGFALHQLIVEYAKEKGVNPSSLFQNIPLCLPDSQTHLPNSKIKKRKPIFPISLCGSEKSSIASFIWASNLHRIIADKLNKTTIQKPEQYLSTTPQWELPHVEMVFFVIGDRQWVDAPEILTPETPLIHSGKRGDIIGPCPWCGYPVKVRQSGKTGELYEGCTNFPVCRYKGNRSH
jgi:hypothetical protein